ncbi:MAG: class-II fumarase/aspartase family protein [Burkholderiaceae bacterium]
MTSNRPNQTDIDALFSTHGRWQSWLTVESALAASQAELGIIPESAAREIADKAQLSKLDVDAMTAEMQATKAPVLAMVHALASACNGNAGSFVHWGATTQNIILTGRVLQMRIVHQRLLESIGDSLRAMSSLANNGAAMIMAGRTNGQHALPITFGFKVAGWIDEFLRYETRFRQIEPRLFGLIFGGAIGAMQAFGDKGPALTKELGNRLDLAPVMVPSRSMTDHFVEYVALLALFGTSCSKIAREIYALMSQEISEVHEGQSDSVIGSSTMPQKVNPKLSVQILGHASELRSALMPALDAGEPGHEGDATSNRSLYSAIDRACPLAFQTASGLVELLENVRPDPARMAQNLALTGGAISAENVMMQLATVCGRQRAHDLVHEALKKARQHGRPILEELLACDQIASMMSEQSLRGALDPANYTGQSQVIARQAAQAAHEAALRLTK